MSLLMFALAPRRVMVVTDTLATGDDGSPLMFASKCVPMAHLNLAVAFTGVATLGNRWTALLQEHMLSRDVEMVDAHAPAVLANLWRSIRREYGPFEQTATVYHFGRSATSGAYVGYAYRAINGFVSERLPYGFGVRPAPAHPLEHGPADLTDLINLARWIRREQDESGAPDRLHIGGALTLTALAGDEIAVKEIYRFDDFDDMWREMSAPLVTS
jgi:hypothetical protein